MITNVNTLGSACVVLTALFLRDLSRWKKQFNWTFSRYSIDLETATSILYLISEKALIVHCSTGEKNTFHFRRPLYAPLSFLFNFSVELVVVR